MRKYLLLLVLATIATPITACDKKSVSTGNGNKGVTEKGGAPKIDGAYVLPEGITDANIFYLIDAVHLADSSTGALAATKGTSSEIRDFGKLMIKDHHALRAQAELLAKKLGIIPSAPAGDTSAAMLGHAMSTLNGAMKGRDFDKAYVDFEVMAHLRALEILTASMPAARDPQLKFYIQKAAPVVLGHLDHIKQLQAAAGAASK